MMPIPIRSSGSSRPRLRDIPALSAPNEDEQADRDQNDRPEEIPAEAAEEADVVEQEVGAEGDQDDARPEAARSAAVSPPPPSAGRRWLRGRVRPGGGNGTPRWGVAGL